jgi:hypothetical protein
MHKMFQITVILPISQNYKFIYYDLLEAIRGMLRQSSRGGLLL